VLLGSGCFDLPDGDADSSGSAGTQGDSSADTKGTTSTSSSDTGSSSTSGDATTEGSSSTGSTADTSSTDPTSAGTSTTEISDEDDTSPAGTTTEDGTSSPSDEGPETSAATDETSDDDSASTGELCGVEGGEPCECPNNYFGPACAIYFDAIDLPLGHNQGTVTAVSRDGTTVVGSSRGTSTNTIALRWRGGTSESLGVLQSGYNTLALAVNGDGSVVVGDAEVPVGTSGSVTTVGFIWDGGLDDLPLPEFGTVAHALAISSDGETIVGWGDNDGEHRALRWVNEGVSTVPGIDPLFFESLSPDGSLAGGYMRSGATPGTPMVWASGTTAIGGLTGYSGGSVLASSTDGSIRIGYLQANSGSDNLAVRWIGTTAVSLMGDGDPSRARALGVSGDGSTIVGSADSQAFLCRNGTAASPTMELLAPWLADAGVDLTSWTLTEAVDVSQDGRTIVGNAQRGAVSTPWILRLPAP